MNRRRRYKYYRSTGYGRGWKKKRLGGGFKKYVLTTLKDLKKSKEWKVADISTTISNISDSGTGYGITYIYPNITQGTGADERIGCKIEAKKLDLTLILDNSVGTSPADCLVRLIIIRWKGTINPATALNASDVMLNNSLSSYKQIVDSNATACVTVMDKLFRMNVEGDGNPIKVIKFGTRFNHEIMFNDDATGNEADCIKNGLYIIHQCSTSGSSNTPNLSVTGRLRYVDG